MGMEEMGFEPITSVHGITINPNYPIFAK